MQAGMDVSLGRSAYVAIYLVFTAVAARTLAIEGLRPQLPFFLAVELVFVLLYSAVFLLQRRLAKTPLQHLYFTLQSALILWLIASYPDFDFLILLYFLLSAQAALVFGVPTQRVDPTTRVGRALWVWVSIFVLLSGGALVYYHGVARGLALSLTTIASEIVVPAYILVYYENESARRRSQALLDELEAANRRLQAYAGQVEHLATLQERNRLARELHDTVSQLIFSISLTARSAQLLLESGQNQALPGQLTRLKELTAEALAQLRSLITKLRPL